MIYHQIEHYPVTGFCLIVLTATSTITRTLFTEISQKWLKRLGYAPRHLWEFKFHKILLCALVTHGPRDFIQAVLMIGIFLGTLEHFAGSLNAGIIFLTTHIVSLTAISIGVKIPVHLADWNSGKALMIARDVGPSAGYFGSLGATLYFVNGNFQSILFVVLIAALVAAFFIRPPKHIPEIVKKHADTAHMIALIYGYTAVFVLMKYPIFF